MEQGNVHRALISWQLLSRSAEPFQAHPLEEAATEISRRKRNADALLEARDTDCYCKKKREAMMARDAAEAEGASIDEILTRTTWYYSRGC